MGGSGVVAGIIQPVRDVLNGVTVPVQRLLIHAVSRDGLDQFDLGIARVGDLQLADPVPRFAEVSALGVLCRQVVHMEEASDPHCFDKELFGSRDVSDDPGNLAEGWSK
jgi:hypothetical protein